MEYEGGEDLQMSSDDIKEILREWLEESRESYAFAIKKAGLPTLVKMPVPVVEIHDEGSISTKYVYEEFSILRTPRFFIKDIKLPDLDRLKPVAEFLFSKYGDRCKYQVLISPLQNFSGVNDVSFDEEPITWIIHNIFGECLVQYIGEVSDISKPDKELLSRIIEFGFEFPNYDLIDILDVIPVAGLNSDSPLIYKNLLLRPLTPREMGNWSMLPMHAQTFPGQLNLTLHSGLAPFFQPSHALEIRTKVDKRERPEVSHLAQRFIIALQLLGLEPGSYASGERSYHPDWGFFGRIKPMIRTGLSSMYANKEIDQECFEEAYELAQLIDEAAVTSPSSAQDIALHRFNLSLTREKEIDALIDLTICLEALLLPRIRDELRFRFRLHGSLWLSEDPEERKSLYEHNLKKIYDTRSAIVHGGQFPTTQELNETVIEAKELTRKALLKAMKQGWPTADTFKELCLS